MKNLIFIFVIAFLSSACGNFHPKGNLKVDQSFSLKRNYGITKKSKNKLIPFEIGTYQAKLELNKKKINLKVKGKKKAVFHVALDPSEINEGINRFHLPMDETQQTVDLDIEIEKVIWKGEIINERRDCDYYVYDPELDINHKYEGYKDVSFFWSGEDYNFSIWFNSPNAQDDLAEFSGQDSRKKITYLHNGKCLPKSDTRKMIF